ncbi:MAG TPA: AAA family ATPase, partial [Methanosarcina sp.]|nr:AAA family ATPase [Methanosarcina sp.]
MRYLVFLRGIPGSGKSTFARENKLEPYTISSDSVRLLIKPPVLSITGKTVISQKINRRVWGLIYSLIKCRMEDGDFIVLDATNAGNADIAKYRKLVRTYRYSAICVDFSEVPLEIAKERNGKRPEYEVVPETVIDELYSIINRQKVPSFVTVIKPQKFHEKIQYKPTDFSNYRKVHHIGDIAGNYMALMQYLACGLNDSDLYIFLGDYIGSGTENTKNTEIIKFLISIMCRNNVILLEGDKEKSFCRLAEGGERSHVSEFAD